MTLDLDDPLPRASTLRSPIVASASPLNADPAHGAAPRGRRRRGDRAAVAVRGGDRGRGARAEPRARAGHRALRRGARLLPGGRATSPTPVTGTSPASSGSSARSSIPVIASLNATTHGRLGPLRAAHRRTRAPMRSSSTSTTSPPTRRRRGRRSRPPTSSSSRPCGPRSRSRSRSSSARTTRRSAHFAAAVVDAGADGLVLFNRFYQPDLDLESLDVVARVELCRPVRSCAFRCAGSPSSGPRSGRPSASPRARVSTTGTTSVKALAGRRRRRDAHLGDPAPRAGASSARSKARLRAWLDEHEYESVGQLRGSASRRDGARTHPPSSGRTTCGRSARGARRPSSRRPRRAVQR